MWPKSSGARTPTELDRWGEGDDGMSLPPQKRGTQFAFACMMFFSDPAAKGRDLKCLVSVWDGAGATLVSGSVRSTHFHNYLLSLFDSLFSYGRHPNFWSPFGLRTSPELAIFESAN